MAKRIYERRPIADRFWEKVNQSGPVPEDRLELGPCWLWTAATLKAGYGLFSPLGKMGLAHRFAYELLVGPIPDGLTLDHLCRNPSCVNPTHLEPVTGRVNILRSDGITAANARKTHCKHGHEFTSENTYVTPRGKRMCRVCMQAAKLRYRARHEGGRPPLTDGVC